MAYLGGSGRLRHTEIEGFLSQLSERPEPPESYFWAMWGTSVALLGLERLADQVEAAIADGRIDPLSLTSDQFQKLLQQAIDDPSRTAGFHADRIGPFGDAIAALALWYGPGTASTSAIRTGVPISAPTPEKVKIGRNDRCPCGNGKKYKHCCLKNG
jgi:pimeloyl-ACP methyl ester carboxylesterase